MLRMLNTLDSAPSTTGGDIQSISESGYRKYKGLEIGT
jgi:hypothetical protein